MSNRRRPQPGRYEKLYPPRPDCSQHPGVRSVTTVMNKKAGEILGYMCQDCKDAFTVSSKR